MGENVFDEQGVPSAPGAGVAKQWPDNVGSGFFERDDTRCWGRTHRAAVASQGPGFASDTYLTNSGLLIPSFGLQAQTMFEWLIAASKTAAGTATPIIQVRIGSNQTTADTSRLTLTGPAQTAAIDSGILTVLVTVRNVGASGVLQGHMSWGHNGAAAGFANNDAGAADATSSAFDNSALSGLFAGLSINGGGSAAWTITQVRAQAIW